MGKIDTIICLKKETKTKRIPKELSKKLLWDKKVSI